MLQSPDLPAADADAPASSLPIPSACTRCTRPNCLGAELHQPHNAYLGCRRCGIELNDIRPLFHQPAAQRSRTECELCGLRYRKARYAALHFGSHFNVLTRAQRPLLCVQCAADASPPPDGEEQPAAKRRRNGEPDDDQFSVEMLEYECEECSNETDDCEPQFFSTEHDLNMHRLGAHGIEMLMEVMGDEDDDDDDDNADDDDGLLRIEFSAPSSFKCDAPDCNAEFATHRRLACHRSKAHAAAAPLQCRLCDDDDANDGDGATKPEIFASRAALRAHEDAHHRNAETERFDCAHCDRHFGCASFLALHRIKHTGVKRFECPECGKAFGRLGHLKYHQKASHAEERLFECAECGDEGERKRFKTAESLRRHRVHMHPAAEAERRRYACEQCDRVFKDSSDLRRHRFGHGGFERAFGCELCEKRFFEARGLRKHMLTHVRKGEKVDGK